MPYVTPYLPINIILVSLPPSIKKMRTNSLGRYTQSIQAKDICILLVNDDYVCRDIVSDMLDNCRYEAFSYDRETDAVKIIREKADTIELILTNVHRTYASRYGIIEHIEKKFNMKIIFMSPDVDDIKNASRGGTSGVTVYFMKSLSVSEMNNLWASALAREKGKRESLSANTIRVENAGSKRTRENDEQNGSVEKKPRVVWTKEMHQKFLEAVNKLGHDKAFPKKIVELMNVPGLTRENVASHLQKYRMCMKRAQEGFTGSLYDLTYPFGFNIPQENRQKSHWNPFQLGPRNTTTTATTTATRHFDLSSYSSRAGLPRQNYTSLLSTIQLKPDHNFRVYGDQKKNVLLSIGDSMVVQSNTSFAGFRLTRDGKSVMFGENNHLSKSCIQSPSVHQQLSFPEMGTGDSSHCPSMSVSFTSVAPLANEPAKFNTQLSSLAALLDLDEPMSPLGSGWTKEANFTEQPSQPTSVATPWTNCGEPVSFTCQQQQQHSSMMAQPESGGLEWADWAESPGFSPQLPPSGNDTNTNGEIFSDFSSTSLPPDICELGTVVDDYGVDTSAISVFDDLLFDHQELT